MASPQLAVALREPLPWADLLELVRTAEDTGYEAVFVPETGNREAFGQLAGFAAATSRVRVGTGVVSVESRSPVIVAAGAVTLHEASGGRFVLGLGAGFAPLATLSQSAKEIRAAMEASPVPHDTLPPVWFAALGDRAVALAAREADGVILNWCTPERAADAVEIIRRERGGLDGFTVAVYLRCSLTGIKDEAPFEALAEVSRVYAALPHYRRQFEAMGLGPEAQRAAAGEPVPERLVDAICVRGGRDAFRARADAFAQAGVDLVVVYPVPAREPASSMLGTILAAAPDTTVER
ncbi:MAG: LLM class flavin-dependent oxidoreductase [Actinobacteria bacterium]|nr:LLM class flavin-dependent oxidoreductase [Actinomycetota bacterium]